jgi:hypothetical protein
MGNILTVPMGNVLTARVGKVLDIYMALSIAMRCPKTGYILEVSYGKMYKPMFTLRAYCAHGEAKCPKIAQTGLLRRNRGISMTPL